MFILMSMQPDQPNQPPQTNWQPQATPEPIQQPVMQPQTATTHPVNPQPVAPQPMQQTPQPTPLTPPMTPSQPTFQPQPLQQSAPMAPPTPTEQTVFPPQSEPMTQQNHLPQPGAPAPVAIDSVQTNKDLKTIKIIGIGVIVLSALSLVLEFTQSLTQVGPLSVNTTQVVGAIVLILIGVGILSRKKIAYHLYNIVVILTIIGSIPLLFGMILVMPAVLQIFAAYPLYASIFLALLLVSLAIPIFIIWGGVKLHPKRMRSYFR